MRKGLAIAIMSCAFVLTLGLAACGSGSMQNGSDSEGSASAAPTATTGTSADTSAAPAAATTASAGAEDTSPAAESNAAVKPSADDKAKAEYEHANALFNQGKYYSAKVAFENSGYEDWEQRAAECVQPMPETSELWHNENMYSDTMTLEFNANQDGGKGMYITVYSEDNEPVVGLFINGSDSIVTNIPAGNYYIKDATGIEWYGGDEQFGPDGYYESMVFDEVEGDRYLTVLDDGYAWAISINTGSDEGQGVGSEESGWENRA